MLIGIDAAVSYHCILPLCEHCQQVLQSPVMKAWRNALFLFQGLLMSELSKGAAPLWWCSSVLWDCSCRNTGDAEGVQISGVLCSLEAACDVAERLSVNRIIAICCSCPLRIIIALHVVFCLFGCCGLYLWTEIWALWQCITNASVCYSFKRLSPWRTNSFYLPDNFLWGIPSCSTVWDN